MSVPAGFLAVAEQAAAVAGAVIRPLFRSALLVEAKGDASPVTEADQRKSDSKPSWDPARGFSPRPGFKFR